MKFDTVRILLFSAEFCGVCKGIEKTRIIEKFVDKHSPPRMHVQKLVCGDVNGELSTEEFKKNFAISDSYGVEAFPTFIVEGKRRDGSGFEICRFDSATVSHFSLKEFDRVFEAAMADVEEMEGDVMSQDEASKRISWG